MRRFVCAVVLGGGAYLALGAKVTTTSPASTQPGKLTAVEQVRWRRAYAAFRYEFAAVNGEYIPIPTDVRLCFIDRRAEIALELGRLQSCLKSLEESRRRLHGSHDEAAYRRLRKRTNNIKRQMVSLRAKLKSKQPPDKPPSLPAFRLGLIGGVYASLTVQSIHGPQEMLVYSRHYRQDVWCVGWKTARLVSDQAIDVGGAVIVTGTKTYRTVLGASRTVPVIEPFDLAPYRAGITQQQFHEILATTGLSARQFIAMSTKAQRQHISQTARAMDVSPSLVAPPRGAPDGQRRAQRK